ncbi:hypothetical protein [Sporomusa sp. GT1]|uniref:hypothetical protein n=1 Tax=Sporomusa sp. GT1 TaxID=1534747 RepID=UPI0016698AED|nr:hypothetical protein [Sporomusa sp. GT1]
MWNNEDGKSREIKLIAEYQSIQQPQGTEVVFHRQERKIIKRWIFSCYKYPMSTQKVLDYFDQSLRERGWKKKDIKARGERVDEFYEKENLEFELSLNENNTWTITMTYNDAHY